MTAGHVPLMARANVAVRLLGGFELLVNQNPIFLPTQAQRVLGYLAVFRRPSRRDTLAGNLWPSSSQDRALANLRTAIWRINRSGTHVVITDHSLIRLDGNVVVDTEAAGLVARKLIGAHDTKHLSFSLVLLFEADLLPGWDEDWLVIERERLRQLRMHALEALSHRLLLEGRYSEAIDAAITAVAAEPLRESAHAALVAVYIAEGNVSEASREIERYRDLLGQELGIEPSGHFLGMLDHCARIKQPS